MLYCNCHYKYKNQICELISCLSETYDECKMVRVRLQDNSEINCQAEDLKEIPLTESILQSCYKMKTIMRDGEWDILWNLGGADNITIGEKQGRFFLFPSKSVETVIEVLPYGLEQGVHIVNRPNTYELKYFSELEHFHLDLIKPLGRLVFGR